MHAVKHCNLNHPWTYLLVTKLTESWNLAPGGKLWDNCQGDAWGGGKARGDLQQVEKPACLTIVRMLFGFDPHSVFVTNSTKVSTNSETAMLSTTGQRKSKKETKNLKTKYMKLKCHRLSLQAWRGGRQGWQGCCHCRRGGAKVQPFISSLILLRIIIFN